MNVLSLFSGAGGLDRGLELAGHTVVAQCEIDPTCREVLRRHWPSAVIHDDVTTLDGKAWRGRVDLVAGGSPCQDLSVAGRRAGLDGERSGLFWHQCRIAAESAARWVLWENVAGALSSNDGQDFAAVLWGLTGLRPAVPENGWRTVGLCVGPDRTAVWRLLDARWFGVAQRRRRVFVVAGPRAECGPEILLEPESCGGDPRARPAASEDVAGTLGGGSGGRGWAPDTDRMTFVPDVFAAFDSTWSGRYPITTEDISPTVKVGSSVGAPAPPAVAFSENQRGEVVLHEYAHQLSAGGGKPGQGYPAVLGTLTSRGGHENRNAGDQLIRTELNVRRLTPRECERLMGWPDDWTRFGAGGREIADSHRYRMCGNGVVSPVAAWIGGRLPSETHAPDDRGAP